LHDDGIRTSNLMFKPRATTTPLPWPTVNTAQWLQRLYHIQKSRVRIHLEQAKQCLQLVWEF